MNEYKQYFKLMCEEVNVKSVCYRVAKTEKGDIYITYVAAHDEFFWSLNDEPIYSKKLEEATLHFLKKII